MINKESSRFSQIYQIIQQSFLLRILIQEFNLKRKTKIYKNILKQKQRIKVLEYQKLHSVSSEESSYWMTQNQLSLGIGLKMSNRLIQGLAYAEPRKNTFSIKSALQQYTYISFYISDMIVIKEENESLSNALSDDALFISVHKSLDYKLIQNINQKACNCSEILLVDDVPFNVQALKTILLQKKIKSDSAYNGIEAIDLVIIGCCVMQLYQEVSVKWLSSYLLIDSNGYRDASPKWLISNLKGINNIQNKIISFFNSLNIQPPAIVACTAYDSNKEEFSIFSDILQPQQMDYKMFQDQFQQFLNQYQFQDFQLPNQLYQNQQISRDQELFQKSIQIIFLIICEFTQHFLFQISQKNRIRILQNIKTNSDLFSI